MQIRKATPEDIPFIEAHAYRLLEFGPPAWRRNEWDMMSKADARHITNALLAGSPDKEVLIATDDAGTRVGFLHLVMQPDYYSGELQAHITDIVVIKSAEGTGVGRFLMEQADEWARRNNAKWITLNVFDDNKHAQAHYEKAGYQREWIRYLKLLKEE
jgi:ribosomal protein S18 acetylase RimI-like enzyme